MEDGLKWIRARVGLEAPRANSWVEGRIGGGCSEVGHDEARAAKEVDWASFTLGCV